MDAQVLDLFKDYYAKNIQLMSNFQDNDELESLNDSMDQLNAKFIDDYFVLTGDRIDADNIADLIAEKLTGNADIEDDDESDNQSSK
ncbi:hypothetical protein [Nicoliella lavandulae]|uniref:Uncharacterized protein n=1 Tax=Nicoliella lavandulae TaxID=3082954 RepID=A0ABU8SL49_9LACO